MKTLPLKLQACHLYLELNDELWLIDTGAPISFGSPTELCLAGQSFRIDEHMLGLTPAKLSRFVGVPCTGLLGADVLGRFDHVFDCARGPLTLSPDPLEHSGQVVQLTALMGVPILTAHRRHGPPHVLRHRRTVLVLPAPFARQLPQRGPRPRLPPWCGAVPDRHPCRRGLSGRRRVQPALRHPSWFARRLLDPLQADLICAHVTLCREDELAELDPALLRARLAAPAARCLTLQFGQPKTFAGHGVLLPCVAGDEEFSALRRWVLDSPDVRRAEPHLTLAHPRNPRSEHNTAANVAAAPRNLSVRFPGACLIRQQGAAAWGLLELYALSSDSPHDT